MRISVRRMGVYDLLIGSFLGTLADDFRRTEQFGTDGQARGACGFHVDAQPDAAILGRELDHDAALGGSVRLRYGQGAAMIQQREDLPDARDLRAVDEQDLAVVDL